MTDTLAPRAVIGVMTPAMNTVVQPELEQLKPSGVSNQMQRFRLGGDQISDDLFDEAEKLMDCKPDAISIALTTDAANGGVEKLEKRCQQLAEHVGVPVLNASIATQRAVRAIGARRISVLTPFNTDIDRQVKANLEAGGFEVVAIKGTESPSLEAICETPVSLIREVVEDLAQNPCDAIVQIGTALPVVNYIEEFEHQTGKSFIACNAAVYWQTLRAICIKDELPGFGQLFSVNE